MDLLCRACNASTDLVAHRLKQGRVICRECWKASRRRWASKKRGFRPLRASMPPAEVRRRMLARVKARQTVRRGKLARQPCEVCGAAKAEAHHDDYSKPLNVRWLCRLHHLELHRLAA